MSTPRTTLNFSIVIRADRSRIWSTLTGRKSFGEWCGQFEPGSRYEGDWSEGSTVRMFGPDADSTDPGGSEHGVVARVEKHVTGEILELRHVGVILKNEVRTEGEEAEEWIGCEEVYTLEGGPHAFTLHVRNRVPESCAEFVTPRWPLALDKIRELAESEFDVNRDLRFERIVAASPSELYRAWTDPDSYAEWFCPKPYGVSAARIDARPGGEFFTVIEAPDGAQSPGLGCILEAIPDRRFTFTSAMEPGFRPVPEPFFTATVEFEPHPEGTCYRVTARHATPEKADEHVAMGFEPGWNAALVQLLAYIDTAKHRSG
jgi:uncharacterized protein YndB with AHSA1/START domain